MPVETSAPPSEIFETVIGRASPLMDKVPASETS
jgi:hypothetical protein